MDLQDILRQSGDLWDWMVKVPFQLAFVTGSQTSFVASRKNSNSSMNSAIFCTWQVLVVMEEKFKRKYYGPTHTKTILSFETDSVPVQQFQARIAELVLRHGGRDLHIPNLEVHMVPLINLALRVRCWLWKHLQSPHHTASTNAIQTLFNKEGILFKTALL